MQFNIIFYNQTSQEIALHYVLNVINRSRKKNVKLVWPLCLALLPHTLVKIMNALLLEPIYRHI